MTGPVREHAGPLAWWQWLAPDGWATQPYWPEGYHGKVWNWLHGKGWRTG